MAIPSFNGFQKRARASEAKTNLGSLYTAEKGYHYEKDTYSIVLADIGFGRPDGDSAYAVGFKGSVGVNYWGTGDSSKGTATATAASDTEGQSMASTCAAAAATFKACATGTTNTASDYNINEKKVLATCSRGC